MARILLPIDGAECALRGVELIVAKRSLYANADNLDIHLVNVQPPFSQYVGRFISREQMARFHREESEKRLRRARQLLGVAGLKCTCHHKVGRVDKTIAELAESLRCDQIVMGAHGRGAFMELLFGSVTQKVVELSTIPVLLVK